MSKAKQPVSINGIEFDALIEENRTFEATVPEYSVENGFVISDSIILNAEKLDMTLFVTDTPVTWSRHAEQGRTEKVVSQLEALYYSKSVVTIVTTDRVFTNMAITAMSLRKTLEVGYAREIPISFQKIRVTSSRTTSIPDSYGKSGATGENAGSANTTTGTVAGSDGSDNTAESSGNRSSIIYGLADKVGMFEE